MADELPDDFDVIVLGTGMPCVYKCSNVIKFDVTNLQAFVIITMQPMKRQFQVQLLRSDLSLIFRDFPIHRTVYYTSTL